MNVRFYEKFIDGSFYGGVVCGTLSPHSQDIVEYQDPALQFQMLENHNSFQQGSVAETDADGVIRDVHMENRSSIGRASSDAPLRQEQARAARG